MNNMEDRIVEILKKYGMYSVIEERYFIDEIYDVAKSVHRLYEKQLITLSENNENNWKLIPKLREEILNKDNEIQRLKDLLAISEIGEDENKRDIR